MRRWRDTDLSGPTSISSGSKRCSSVENRLSVKKLHRWLPGWRYNSLTAFAEPAFCKRWKDESGNWSINQADSKQSYDARITPRALATSSGRGQTGTAVPQTVPITLVRFMIVVEGTAVYAAILQCIDAIRLRYFIVSCSNRAVLSLHANMVSISMKRWNYTAIHFQRRPGWA